MAVHISGLRSGIVLPIVLVALGLVTSYALYSRIWVVAAACGLVLLMLVIAALPIKRKVTPQQFADLLEPHLLGTDGKWGWDDAISIRLADERLELLRLQMSKFDRLATKERHNELKEIIEVLRRGEIPDVNQAKNDSRI